MIETNLFIAKEAPWKAAQSRNKYSDVHDGRKRKKRITATVLTVTLFSKIFFGCFKLMLKAWILALVCCCELPLWWVLFSFWIPSCFFVSSLKFNWSPNPPSPTPQHPNSDLRRTSPVSTSASYWRAWSIATPRVFATAIWSRKTSSSMAQGMSKFLTSAYQTCIAEVMMRHSSSYTPRAGHRTTSHLR